MPVVRLVRESCSRRFRESQVLRRSLGVVIIAVLGSHLAVRCSGVESVVAVADRCRMLLAGCQDTAVVSDCWCSLCESLLVHDLGVSLFVVCWPPGWSQPAVPAMLLTAPRAVVSPVFDGVLPDCPPDCRRDGSVSCAGEIAPSPTLSLYSLLVTRCAACPARRRQCWLSSVVAHRCSVVMMLLAPQACGCQCCLPTLIVLWPSQCRAHRGPAGCLQADSPCLAVTVVPLSSSS